MRSHHGLHGLLAQFNVVAVKKNASVVLSHLQKMEEGSVPSYSERELAAAGIAQVSGSALKIFLILNFFNSGRVSCLDQ